MALTELPRLVNVFGGAGIASSRSITPMFSPETASFLANSGRVNDAKRNYRHPA